MIISVNNKSYALFVGYAKDEKLRGTFKEYACVKTLEKAKQSISYEKLDMDKLIFRSDSLHAKQFLIPSLL